jgi:hypothetical protein
MEDGYYSLMEVDLKRSYSHEGSELRYAGLNPVHHRPVNQVRELGVYYDAMMPVLRSIVLTDQWLFRSIGGWDVDVLSMYRLYFELARL